MKITSQSIDYKHQPGKNFQRKRKQFHLQRVKKRKKKMRKILKRRVRREKRKKVKKRKNSQEFFVHHCKNVSTFVTLYMTTSAADSFFHIVPKSFH
jgi:hypothetical protein